MLTDNVLEGLSVAELSELKVKIASLIKAKREGEKQNKALEKSNRTEWAKSNLKNGDIVTFSYKGEELEGEIAEMRDKTFSVAFEYEGEDKVISRLYHLFISKAGEEEDAA